MEAPLERVLAGISMVELETQIVSTLGNMVLNWKSFVDDTIGYVKTGSFDIIHQILKVSIPTYGSLAK